MTRITVGWPSGTREIERSETPQRSIDLKNSCQFCLLFIALYCCHHFDNFQVVLTQNMEFCVLRTAGWPRPSHNLESQEVLHVEMVCHEEKVKSHLTLQSSNKHCPLRDRQCSSSDRSRQKNSQRTEKRKKLRKHLETWKTWMIIEGGSPDSRGWGSWLSSSAFWKGWAH